MLHTLPLKPSFYVCTILLYPKHCRQAIALDGLKGAQLNYCWKYVNHKIIICGACTPLLFSVSITRNTSTKVMKKKKQYHKQFSKNKVEHWNVIDSVRQLHSPTLQTQKWFNSWMHVRYRIGIIFLYLLYKIFFTISCRVLCSDLVF